MYNWLVELINALLHTSKRVQPTVPVHRPTDVVLREEIVVAVPSATAGNGRTSTDTEYRSNIAWEKVVRQLHTIIVHCSDSPDDRDSVDVDEIRRWHLKRGFSNVGYHFVIKRDGTVQLGRPLYQIGAHAQGHNSGSVGICWVGRDKPSAMQYAALIDLIKYLQECRSEIVKVLGHKEVDPNKTCPNIDMDVLRKGCK